LDLSLIDSDLMRAVLVGPPDDEILILETRLRSAQMRAAVEELDALLSDDLLFSGPTGTLATKQEDLSAYATGAIRFLAHLPEELRVRRIGRSTALVSLRAQLSVEVSGRVVSGAYRYTRVWAQENAGNWKVVGGHVSALAVA